MPDELPVIDMHSEPSALVIAAGFSGNGFGIGSVVGKFVTDFVVIAFIQHASFPIVRAIVRNAQADRDKFTKLGRPTHS